MILSLILWSPLLLGLVLLFLPAEPVTLPRRAAFVFSLFPFVCSLVMLARFDSGHADGVGYQGIQTIRFLLNDSAQFLLSGGVSVHIVYCFRWSHSSPVETWMGSS